MTEPYDYRPVDDASGRRDHVGGLTDIPLYGEPAPYVHQVTGYETSHLLRRRLPYLLAAGVFCLAVYAGLAMLVGWWPR